MSMQRSEIGVPLGRTVWVALLTAGLMGCPPDPRDNIRSPVVATVGDAQIDRETFLSALTTAGTARIESKALREQQARAVLDRLMEDALLLQGAESAGVVVTNEDIVREIRKSSGGYPPGEFRRMLDAEQITFSDYRARIKQRLTIDAFLKEALAERKEVDPALVQARYQATIANHPHREEVRVRQVLVKTDEEANYILSEIRKRHLRLEEAARRYSMAPEAQDGGDLGWFSKGQLPEIFDICFSLKPGEVSEVVSSEYGFHIFELVARQADQAPPTLEQSQAALTRDIVREQEAKGMEILLSKLHQQFSTSVDEGVFKEVVGVLPPPPPKKNELDDNLGHAWSTYNAGGQTAGSGAQKQDGSTTPPKGSTP